jgi:hypothetical protein
MLNILSPELVIVVENDGCNASHSKLVEQAFYSKYTGK